MPRVCIIAPSSLRYMPYLRYYEDALTAAGVGHDILLWDRYCTGELPANAHAYRRAGTVRGIALVPAYLGFRRFLLSHLKARPYDIYVVLGVQLGVLLYDFLRTRPFILDVRDYSHEGALPYRALGFDLVRRARLVCISSQGFLEWLPSGVDYVVSHNLSRAYLQTKAAPFDRGRKVFSCIGAVGYFGANVRFLEGAGRLRDWDVRYIGHGTCEEELESHCRTHGITNVTFRGAYLPEQKAGFFDSTNFVLGVYGDDSRIVRTLTPNRLYEACVHRRPVVVNKGTFLAGLVAAKGLGVVIDLDQSGEWGKALDGFYEPGRYEEFVGNCGRFLEAVESDMATFDRRIGATVGACGSAG